MTFLTSVIDDEPNDDPYANTVTLEQALDTFKRWIVQHTIDQSLIYDLGFDMSSMLKPSTPANRVSWRTTDVGRDLPQYSQYLFSYMHRVHVVGPQGQYVSDDDLPGYEPFLDFELEFSHEAVRLQILRSVWSQHYPATQHSTTRVPFEPLVSSDIITVDDSAVQLPQTQTVRDVLRTLFNRDVYKSDEKMLERSVLHAVTKSRNQAFPDVVDILSYTDGDGTFVDKSIATLDKYGSHAVITAAVCYRLGRLLESAVDNAFYNPSGPWAVRALQQLLPPPDERKRPRAADSYVRSTPTASTEAWPTP
jgi:hypothetical protein